MKINIAPFLLSLCLAAIFMVAPAFAFRADDDDAIRSAANTTLLQLSPVQQKLPTLAQKTSVESLGEVEVDWDAKTGAPASIRGKDLAARNLGGKGLAFGRKGDFAADAVAVIDRLSKAFSLRDAAAEFSSFKVESDQLGFRHVRLNQVY